MFICITRCSKMFVLIVLSFLCFISHSICSGLDSSDVGEQLTYFYNATSTVQTNLTSNTASQWSLSAKLIIQSYKNYKIMKLNDIKTNSFNGRIEDHVNHKEIPISEEVYKLSEPFLVNYNNKYEKLESINFLPDEPVWSKNIKRAIASVYQLDFNKVPNSPNEQQLDEELTIQGRCQIIYRKLMINSRIQITKEIENNCFTKNTKSIIPLGNYTTKTVRHYTLSEIPSENKNNNIPIENIKSKNIFSYWLMNSDRIIHELHQSQEFVFLNKEPIKNTTDVSRFTEKSTPYFEYENNVRNVKPNSTKETILSQWMDEYQQIKNHINQNTSTMVDEYKFNIIEKLRKTLREMNMELLNNFKNDEFEGSSQMMNLFSSLLPYIGTADSIRYIKSMIENQDFHLPDLRLLSLFPLYVTELNEDILHKMEDLLNLNNLGSSTIKQNYILSFSNLVQQMYFLKLSSTNNETEASLYYKTIAKKYIDKYYQLFLETRDYSLRMKYLFGMVNMGETSMDHLLSILKNTTESRHVRALAMNSIRPDFLNKKHEIYQQFSPILKDTKEAFEIRAAALSLLLASDINSSELYAILSYMNQTSYDPARQHLHNYFYTSVQSGKTDCEQCSIKNLAKMMLPNLNPPETNQGLLTSYHQVSYTDDENNFETSLNLHVVANPITNFANVFKVTLNHFTGQQKTGEYSIYVKAEGISNKLYKEEYERHFAIKELYRILQDLKVVLSDEHNEELHMELIFCHKKQAIISVFINIDNVDEMSDFIDEVIVYLKNNDIITIREVEKIHFASDLGTPVYTTLNYEHILGTEFGNYDKIFLNVVSKEDDDENYVLTRIRSMWSSKMNLITYNPLTNINHGVSRVFSNQNFIKFKIDYNVYDLSIRWNDNTSYLDTLIEHKYAVFVDNANNLKKFCTNCQSIVFLTNKDINEKKINFWLWAKNIIIKETNCSNPRYPKYPLHEIIKKSKVSYAGVPLAQPFVLITYIADYLYHVPQYDMCSLSINSERIIKEPNLSTLKITFINDALDENYKLNLNFNITLALTQREIPSKKLLNQWNLNVQRQELKTGVYYELHYDDNGRGEKLDVHSDLDYVPVSPNPDMYSLKPAEPIVSRTSIQLKEKNTSPTTVHITSLFSVSDDQIIMVNASKSFDLCQKDHDSDYFKNVLKRNTPPTKSCYNSSLGLSTYDNYAITIKFTNVSDKIRNYLENEVLKPIKNKNSVEEPLIKEKTFNVSVIYSALYSALNMNIGSNHIVSNYSVPELVRPWALLKPTSRLIDELRYNVLGLDNVCVIIPRYVISFTGKIIEHDTDTSIVPLIECTNTTRLGLTTNRFTYKLWSDENTFQLGKKEGGYYIMRNGKYLKRNVRAEDYVIEFVNDHTFHITTSRIDLYYNGEYLSIKIKSAFINRMCGMCTTSEYDPSNTVNKYFN